MKNLFKKPIVFILIASLSFTQVSCFGTFELTRKVYNFNDTAIENKFGKTLLFYALNIIPVYSIAASVDFFILNLIEFWTGSNPIAMADGEEEFQIIQKYGITYEMKVTKNKYQVTVLDGDNKGKVSEVIFNEEDLTWNHSSEGVTTELSQIINQDGVAMVKFNTAQGKITMDLEQVEIAMLNNEAELLAKK